MRHFESWDLTGLTAEQARVLEDEANTFARNFICPPPILDLVRGDPEDSRWADFFCLSERAWRTRLRTLAVDRRYRRSDYIPCIAWGALSYHCGGLEPGDPLWLEGRLQSRVYRKVIGEEVQERTAFEVSVSALDEPTEEAEAPSAEEETNMGF